MKKNLNLLLVLCITLLMIPSYTYGIEGKTDTITVFSQKMQKDIKNIIILPANYDENRGEIYPVLYLLHGYGGNYKTWATQTKKTLAEEANKWNIIVVCPDGENSWYWDSPINPKSQFETYVSKELVNYVDNNYKTKASAKGRAITGFSMGGHGGLWLGINHPDVFGACGSMSGGVDIRPFPNSWDMKKHLGTYKANPKVWDDHTVINQLDKIEPNTLSVIIDCGYEDFFYQVNEELHKQMLYKNIPHDYIVRPGGHTHEYWNNAIDYQMQYFSKFFNQK